LIEYFKRERERERRETEREGEKMKRERERRNNRGMPSLYVSTEILSQGDRVTSFLRDTALVMV